MIYLLEDDDSIRELMVYALRASGYSVMGLPEAGKLWEQLPRKRGNRYSDRVTGRAVRHFQNIAYICIINRGK